jgi:hypothetical protein
MPRGALQELQSEARKFCGMVVCFARYLKWHTLANLLASLQVSGCLRTWAIPE